MVWYDTHVFLATSVFSKNGYFSCIDRAVDMKIYVLVAFIMLQVYVSRETWTMFVFPSVFASTHKQCIIGNTNLG